MSLPPSESSKIPEGVYTFQIMEEAEKRRKTSPATGKEFVVISLKLRVTNESGFNAIHNEKLIPWLPLYEKLLLAIGGKRDDKGAVHLGDISEVGKTFKGELKHVPDKEDPDKSWARIVDIEVPKEDSSPATEESSDDIPF